MYLVRKYIDSRAFPNNILLAAQAFKNDLKHWNADRNQAFTDKKITGELTERYQTLNVWAYAQTDQSLC